MRRSTLGDWIVAIPSVLCPVAVAKKTRFSPTIHGPVTILSSLPLPSRGRARPSAKSAICTAETAATFDSRASVPARIASASNRDLGPWLLKTNTASHKNTCIAASAGPRMSPRKWPAPDIASSGELSEKPDHVIKCRHPFRPGGQRNSIRHGNRGNCIRGRSNAASSETA